MITRQGQQHITWHTARWPPPLQNSHNATIATASNITID